MAPSFIEIERQQPPYGGCLSSLSSLHRREERFTMTAYPSVAFIQGQIRRLEGFAIIFRNRDGRNTRDDLELPKGYPSSNVAAHNMTVSDWKRNRFDPNFMGFDCDVLDGRGNIVPGMTLLSTVRKSYQ
jgi:hypothetical protein